MWSSSSTLLHRPWMPMMWELFNEPFDIRSDGMVHAPDRPGLGFTLRSDALERFNRPGEVMFPSWSMAAVILRHTAAPVSSPAATSSSAQAALSFERLVAIALEHQLRCPPNVDLRDHALKLHVYGQ